MLLKIVFFRFLKRRNWGEWIPSIFCQFLVSTKLNNVKNIFCLRARIRISSYLQLNTWEKCEQTVEGGENRLMPIWTRRWIVWTSRHGDKWRGCCLAADLHSSTVHKWVDARHGSILSTFYVQLLYQHFDLWHRVYGVKVGHKF